MQDGINKRMVGPPVGPVSCILPVSSFGQHSCMKTRMELGRRSKVAEESITEDVNKTGRVM